MDKPTLAFARVFTLPMLRGWQGAAMTGGVDDGDFVANGAGN